MRSVCSTVVLAAEGYETMDHEAFGALEMDHEAFGALHMIEGHHTKSPGTATSGATAPFFKSPKTATSGATAPFFPFICEHTSARVSDTDPCPRLTSSLSSIDHLSEQGVCSSDDELFLSSRKNAFTGDDGLAFTGERDLAFTGDDVEREASPLRGMMGPRDTTWTTPTAV